MAERDKITIKRQFESVGVNRRRCEKRFLSFKDVWRILGRVNSYIEQRAKTRSHGGRGGEKNLALSSTFSCSHIHTFIIHTHPPSRHF